MNNGQTPIIHPKLNLRVTLVDVKLPLLARIVALFTGRLHLAVRGMIQEVVVVDRATAQEIFLHSREKKWTPFTQTPEAAPPHLRGPRLEP